MLFYQNNLFSLIKIKIKIKKFCVGALKNFNFDKLLGLDKMWLIVLKLKDLMELETIYREQKSFFK